jgi:photosystem II stability/assembly factor-like uncharacterized protein
MKVKDYISAISLAILLFSGIQTVKAQNWEALGVPQVNGVSFSYMFNIEGFGDAVYLCTDRGLFQSLDQGTTFTNLTYTSGVTQNKAIECIFVDDANGDMYVGGGEAVYKSTDNGNSWFPTVLTNIRAVDIVKVGSNILVSYIDSSGPNGGVYYSSDGMDTVQESTIVNLGMYDFKFFNNTIFLAGREGIYKSIDNGVSFSVAGTGFPINHVYERIGSEGSSIFVGSSGYGPGLYRSNDNGQTWQNPDPSTFSGICSLESIESVQGYTFVLGSCGIQGSDPYPLKLSQDEGSTWTSGLFNLSDTDFGWNNRLGKNTSGSCFFLYSVNPQELYRMCDLTVGIEENSNSDIAIMPNPTTGNISISGIVGTRSVTIYNTQGKLLKQYLEVTENDILDLSEFSAGLYFININGEKGSKTFKVIKE